MTVSEADLVQQARGGDREAFGELVDRYRDMVYGLGYHLTGEFESARDLAQEAFVQAYGRLGQLREPARFAGWLRQIAINCHRTEARRKRVSTVALTDVEAAPADPLPSDVELVVREALAKLRPPERLALTLHYINGYSHSEIGGFLGVRPEVVNSRLARARRRLREEVLAMAEEMFTEHALPPEFRRDVVAAVGGLVARFEAALPEDLPAFVERLRAERNELWCSILNRMPEPYGRPLPEAQMPKQWPEYGWPIAREDGERKVAMADLPGGLKAEVRQAVCLSWVHWVFDSATERPPWIQDPGRLWILFYEEDGSSLAALADVPEGPAGTFATVAVGPEEGDPQGPPSPAEEVDRILEICAAPAEFRDVLTRLRRAVPGTPGSLGAALYAQMERLLRQVRDQLPKEARAAMEAGKRVSSRDLPPALQETLRRAMFLGWGSYVVGLIEHAPSWLTRFEESHLEFGLMPRDMPARSAGKPYIKLYGPAPHVFQESLDCPVDAEPSS